MILPRQLRAARALLGWNRRICAEVVGLSPETIRNIEISKFHQKEETLEHIQQSFLHHGVGFIGQHGVTLLPVSIQRPPTPITKGKKKP